MDPFKIIVESFAIHYLKIPWIDWWWFILLFFVLKFKRIQPLDMVMKAVYKYDNLDSELM